MERPLNALAILVLSLSAFSFAVGVKLREAAPLEAAGRYVLAREALSTLLEEIDADECLSLLDSRLNGRPLDSYTIGELDNVRCSGTPASEARIDGHAKGNGTLNIEGKPAAEPLQQERSTPLDAAPARPSAPGSLALWSSPDALLYVGSASRSLFDTRDLDLARRYSSVTDLNIYNWQRARDRATAGTSSSGCDSRANPPADGKSCLDSVPLSALRRLASLPNVGLNTLDSDVQDRFRATLPNIEMKVDLGALGIILAWATVLLFGVFVAAVHAVGSSGDARALWILKSLHGSPLFESVGVGLALVPAASLGYLAAASIPVNATPFLVGLAWVVAVVLTIRFITAVWADGALAGSMRRLLRRLKRAGSKGDIAHGGK